MNGASFAQATALSLVAVILLAALAPPASAHAFLVSQDPGPGSRLHAPPPNIRMVFSERLEQAYSYAHVRDGSGTRVDLDGGRVPTGEPNVLIVGLPALPNGTYLVEWATLSVDTHSASGNYSFGIGQAASHEQGAGSALAHAHGFLGTILFFVGLLSLPGILLVTHLTKADGARRREMHAYAAAMAVLGAVGACFIYLAAAEPTGSFGGYLTETRSGPLVATGLTALAGAAAILIRTVTAPRTWHVKAALALAAVAILCRAATSHGAARTSGALVGGAADAIHLAAASIWVGGVVGLALWMPKRTADEAAVAVARFSPWAMGAVAVLIVAGVASASMHLRGPSDLWSTFYGGLLVAKIALAVLLVGLGWFNRSRNGPGLVAGNVSVKRLRRTIAFEASLMFIVVLLTVILTASVPPGQLQ